MVEALSSKVRYRSKPVGYDRQERRRGTFDKVATFAANIEMDARKPDCHASAPATTREYRADLAHPGART
jgi:hypothetical protein